MQKKYVLTLLAIIVLTSVLSPAPGKANPLNITRITPGGENVQSLRQIVIQFDRDVVPLGAMERSRDEIPVTITPDVKGQWRWLDTSALALQLDESQALQPATRYTLIMNPGITALDGTTLIDPVIHTFTTQRPRISWVNFQTWRSPGTPVMGLHFNQPVTPESVKACVKLIRQTDGQLMSAVRVEPHPENASGRIWWISPAKELPLDTAMVVWVSPGIISTQGSEPGMEKRVAVKFHTFPEFKFLGLQCYTLRGKKPIIISPDQFQKFTNLTKPAGTPTSDIHPLSNPDTYTELLFTTPVAFQEIRDRVIITPDLAKDRKDYDPWANNYSGSLLRTRHHKDAQYSISLPEDLTPWQRYHFNETGDGIRDAFGRALPTPMDFTFFTDHRKPDYQLLHPTGVLEKNLDSRLPMAVTNMESMKFSFQTITAAKNNVNGTQSTDKTNFDDETLKKISPPHDIPGSITKDNLMAQDITYHTPMGVREMLEGHTGAVYGKVSKSTPSVKKHANEKQFFAQVTPWQVHAKIGHFNSLVWVTDLATGLPVPGARVSIHKDDMENLTRNTQALAREITDDNGIALLPGVVTLDPERKSFDSWWEEGDDQRLFIRVEQDNDLALLPLNNRFSIDTWQVSGETFDSHMEARHGHINAWGTTAQGIYRAGDTIQYKIYVRDQDNTRFISPPKAHYTLSLIDPAGKSVLTRKKITLSQFGTIHGEYAVPKNGSVGWYRFELSANFTEQNWSPLRVLVSDFTPSPFKVTTELNGNAFKMGDTLTVTSQASLHAGGPYTNANARIIIRLKEKIFRSKHPLAQKFSFYKPFKDEADEENNGGFRPGGMETLLEKTDILNDQGILENTVQLDQPDVAYGTLTVESAVQDDRGKFVAATATAPYLGRDRFVGLKSLKWVYDANQLATLETLVVDDQGNPVSDTKVNIRVQRLETKATRVKGAGNAYLTRYLHQWITTHNLELTTTNEPLPFSFTPEIPGDYRISATVTDTRGKKHASGITTWVTGRGHVVWQEPADYRLKIIPEKNTVNLGETAQYLIKNPFPGAYALITLERYGILRQWVKKMETATEVIEVPVSTDLQPGFFLSATILSPRVAKPLGENQVDLGKPTFRTGYVETRVIDPNKGMEVTVTTAQKVYKPGDTVTVDINARMPNAPKSAPVEFAVAVLDEAVFDLIASGKKHFDIRQGFYTLDGLDVNNYSLLTNIVGRRRLEAKGANVGGDGGGGIDMRSFFKFVSYWNPSLIADDKGHAKATFTVPDNLTGWRIFAMAVTPDDLMGLGEDQFKVNRPTEVRPVMPNQVTAGDSFQAGFSIMNRTPKVRDLVVSMSVSRAGNAKDGSNGGSENINVNDNNDGYAFKDTKTETVHLPPYKRKTVYLPVKTVKPGSLEFKITARDDMDGDGIRHSLKVISKQNNTTSATHGMVMDNTPVTIPIQYPENMEPHTGNTRLVLSPTLLDNVDGAFTYMRDYAYTCWEQKLTRAVMASHYKALENRLKTRVTWEDAGEVPDNMLKAAPSFQAPNGGMTYFKPEDNRVSPYLSAYTALAFNWLKERGYQPLQSVEIHLQEYLLTLLRQNILPDFYSKGMAATVRAVALSALAREGKLTLADIQRYEPHVKRMSLFGKAQFLMAATRVAGGEPIAHRTWEIILTQSVQSAGKLRFNETLDKVSEMLLESSARTQGAILSAMIAYANKYNRQEEIKG
ncbi:MAG: MG2 domain-containing protein, partial [Desulfobacterium sp.]